MSEFSFMSGVPVSYDAREECARLARTFPTLRNAIGVSEGEYPDLARFDDWAAEQHPFDGVREAAQFVLHLFDAGRKWKCGAFNLRVAVTCWDAAHIAAFAAWAKNPIVF